VEASGDGSGTLLLSVDDDKGLKKVGRIESDSWGAQRNVRVGDFVYSFYGNELKVVSLDSPDVVVADVDLTPPPALRMTDNDIPLTIMG